MLVEKNSIWCLLPIGVQVILDAGIDLKVLLRFFCVVRLTPLDCVSDVFQMCVGQIGKERGSALVQTP